MRNILVVVGSAIQDGNTDRLADAFIKGASAKGHHVEKVFLGNQEVQGCMGCGVCQKNKGCVISDDMQALYPLFQQCDTIVFASPLYFWTITARLKAFIERLYALSKNDELPQRDCVLLMSAGDDNFWTFEQPVSYYRFFTQALGWQDMGMCLAKGCNGEAGKRKIDEVYLAQAYDLGNQLK